MQTLSWRGVFPAVTTKFHADERLDLDGTASLADSALTGVRTSGGEVAWVRLGHRQTLSFTGAVADLDPVQLGLIGSAFAWVYAAAAPLAGFVVSGDPKCRTLLKTPASRRPA